MPLRKKRVLVFVTLAFCAFMCPRPLYGELVQVRHQEGLVHGFLVLRSLDGRLLADGDLIQYLTGKNVTTRLIFRFLDGSIHDETAVYSQDRSFRLLQARLLQRGPSFKDPVDLSIDVARGNVTLRQPDRKETKDHLDLPPDLANGLVLTLLKNIKPGQPKTEVSMLATTSKPRLVKLAIVPRGEEVFAIGASRRKAMHYQVKVQIGGVTGLFARVLGKQPPPTDVWILQGEAPAFVKSEGPLYADGPVWRIELASPKWAQAQ